MAKGDHFRSGAYHESIRQEVPEEVLALLSQMGHFRKAYEINEDIAEYLKEAGIKGDFGVGGLKSRVEGLSSGGKDALLAGPAGP